MSHLLIEEHPIAFLPGLASAIGLNEAILLQQLHYELTSPVSKAGDHVPGRVFAQDGTPWIARTYDHWASGMLRMWTPEGIRKIFLKLKELKLIVMAPRNAAQWDNVNLVTIDREAVRALDLEAMAMERRAARSRSPKKDHQAGKYSASSIPDLRTLRTMRIDPPDNEDGSPADNEDGSLYQDTQDTYQDTNQESAKEEKQRQGADAPFALSGEKPKKARKARQGTRSKVCPDDFELDESLLQWAKENTPTVDVKHEFLRFKTWEFKTPRSDWRKAFQNWCINGSKPRTPSATGARFSRAPMTPAEASRLGAQCNEDGFYDF